MDVIILPMTEKSETQETDWTSATYADFLRRQEVIRAEFGATTPFIEGENFPDLMEKRKLFRSAGFDANEHSSGGLSVFIENEDQYKKFQEIAKERGFKIFMQLPRSR